MHSKLLSDLLALRPDHENGDLIILEYNSRKWLTMVKMHENVSQRRAYTTFLVKNEAPAVTTEERSAVNTKQAPLSAFFHSKIFCLNFIHL